MHSTTREWAHLPTSLQGKWMLTYHIEHDTVGFHGSMCHSTSKGGIPNPNREAEEASTKESKCTELYTHSIRGMYLNRNTKQTGKQSSRP